MPLGIYVVFVVLVTQVSSLLALDRAGTAMHGITGYEIIQIQAERPYAIKEVCIYIVYNYRGLPVPKFPAVQTIITRTVPSSNITCLDMYVQSVGNTFVTGWKRTV